MHKLVVTKRNGDREVIDYGTIEELHKGAADYVREHDDYSLSGSITNSTGGRSIIAIQKYKRE